MQVMNSDAFLLVSELPQAFPMITQVNIDLPERMQACPTSWHMICHYMASMPLNNSKPYAYFICSSSELPKTFLDMHRVRALHPMTSVKVWG